MPARPPAPLPGIRTGYCGSLTTFASWNLELLTLAVAQAKVRAEPKRAAGGMCGRTFPTLQNHFWAAAAGLELPVVGLCTALQKYTASPVGPVVLLCRRPAAAAADLARRPGLLGQPHSCLFMPAHAASLPAPMLLLQWGQAVAGYFVGMCGALVAYCVGLHAALLIDRHAVGLQPGSRQSQVAWCAGSAWHLLRQPRRCATQAACRPPPHAVQAARQGPQRAG